MTMYEMIVYAHNRIFLRITCGNSVKINAVSCCWIACFRVIAAFCYAAMQQHKKQLTAQMRAAIMQMIIRNDNIYNCLIFKIIIDKCFII